MKTLAALQKPGVLAHKVGAITKNATACLARYSLTRFLKTAFAAVVAGQSINTSLRWGSCSSDLQRLQPAIHLPTAGRASQSEQIATVSADNPYIGFPYTKLMNSNAFIDQASAIILTSVAKARELGIPESKWVYLHGCADAYDHWYISDRIDHHSSLGDADRCR